MGKKLDSKYNFKKIEDGRYQRWLDLNFFYADPKSSKKPYTIVIPPPNVTGKLHLGHTIDNTMQDVVIRKKRMEGYNALYLPGTDHAGIATQAKVDNLLAESGTNRFLIGREKFLLKSYEWTKKYQGEIFKQWEALGLSLDYKKRRFTLDSGLSDAVFYVFKKLYEEDKIYRGYRIINYDVKAKTALSNIEVNYKEQIGKLYYVKYPVVGENSYVVVATTRPETMFADQALMISPKDKSKKHLIGKSVIIPTTNIKIPIIEDDYVDPSFGTGIVKVTPAHDPNDFLVGKRHNLKMPLCMNEDGTMNELAGKYQNMDRFVCRKELLKDLKIDNLLEKIEDHNNNIGYSERTDTIVEPRLSLQWFVKMSELSRDALKTSVEFVPRNMKKIYNEWMKNTEDWCISRQLWWGHRIPVWYHENGDIKVAKESPGKGYKQDEDVLDTWFSSALWPFSTLNFPNTDDILYKKFYPTDLLITGYDILFFWVARMIFQGRYLTGKDPFKKVLFHGLIRDKQGIKMTKSLQNVIDPIDVIKNYGTDSLRYSLIANSSPGLDLRYDEKMIRSAWNFINKLYNVARFLIISIPNIKELDENSYKLNTLCDKYIISKLNILIKDASKNYDKFLFQEVAKDLANFIWNDFASIYLEASKYYLEKDKDKENTAKVLKYVLVNILKLLHPIIPFVTDFLYENIKGENNLTISSWPKKGRISNVSIDNFTLILDVIKLVRHEKALNNLAYKDTINVVLEIKNNKIKKIFNDNKDLIISLLNLEKLEIKDSYNNKDETLKTIKGINIFIDIKEDKTKNIEEVKKRLNILEKEIERSNRILGNENFMKKANPKKVKEEISKKKKYEDEYKFLLNELKNIK